MATRDEILRFLLEVSGEKDLDSLANSLRTLGKEAKSGESEAAELVARLDKLTTASKGAAEFIRLSAALAETEEKLREAAEGYAALSREFDATDRSSGALSKQFRAAQREIEALTAAQIRQREQLEKVGTELKDAGVNVERLADEEQRLRQESLQAAKAIDTKAKRLEYAREAAERNARALEKMGDALSRLRSGLNDAGQRLLTIGTAAATAAASLAVFGVGKFFSAGIAEAADFESALGRIQAAADLTADEMTSVKATIEDVAANSAKTVEEAAQAFEQLAREGLTAAESQEALKAALDFSTVAAISGSEAVKTLGDAVGAFGIGAERTAQVADILTAAAIKSGLTVGEFAETIKTLGPAAADAGLTLEQTAAAVQLLAQNGIEGGRAAGAMAQVLAALKDPASAFSRELDALGIESRDFSVVLQELGTRGGAAEAAFNSLGDRATLVLRALAQDGGASLAAVRGSLDQVAGATAKAAQTINTDLLTSFGNVQRAFADLRRLLVEPLLEPLADELDALATELRDFAKTAEFKALAESIKGIFVQGLEAAKEFAEGLDLTEAANKIRQFTDEAKASLEDFRGSAGETLRDIKTIFESIGLAFDAVQSGVLGLAAAVAKVSSAVLELEALGARFAGAVDIFGLYGKVLGVDFPKAARDAEIAAGGLNAVFEEFARRFKANFDDVREGLDQFGNALPETAAKAPDAAAAIEAELGRVETSLVKAADASGDFEQSFNQAASGVEQDAQRIAAATQKPLVGLNDLVDASTAAARALQKAVQSGAAPEEVERLQQTFDRAAGKVNEYEQSLDKVADTGEKAAGSVRETGNQVSGLGDDSRKASGEVDELDSSLQGVDQATQSVKISLGEVSQEFAEASERIADFFFRVGGSISQYSRAREKLVGELLEQREAVDKYVESLDQELARYDPLQQAVERLRTTYKFVDEERLRQVALREQRLEELRKQEARAAEEAREVEDRARRDSRPRASNDGPADGGGARPSSGGAGGVTININGFIGSLDRGALERLARQLDPELERLRRLRA